MIKLILILSGHTEEKVAGKVRTQKLPLPTLIQIGGKWAAHFALSLLVAKSKIKT